jgi:hypothetical protein
MILPLFDKISPPGPEMDVKKVGFQDTFIKYVFGFFELFGPLLALKLAKNAV